MSTIKDTGIIIKDVPAGERDKNLTILTSGQGKIYVHAKGASGPKSKFAPFAQPFVYGEFVFYPGPGFLSLTQCEVKESFYGIRQDFSQYIYATFMLEYVDKFIRPSMDGKPALGLLLRSLKALGKGSFSPEFTAAVFEFKFLQLEGLCPVLDACGECGGEPEPFFGGEGLVCQDCRRGDFVRLSPPSLNAIKYIMRTGVDKLFRFHAHQKTCEEIVLAAKIFRRRNVDIDFKSLDLL